MNIQTIKISFKVVRMPKNEPFELLFVQNFPGGGMPPDPPSMNACAFSARQPPQSLPPTFALLPSAQNHFENSVSA